MIQNDLESVERALLVGVNVANEKDFDILMEELKELARACDFYVSGEVIQNLEKVNRALYVGTGKVHEISDKIKELDCDLVIFNNELSPSQLKNLQTYIDVPILDRTGLILEIFAKRARTSEAKLQVEVAKLKYLLPRLVGMHSGLGRQGGGSGLSNKGSGEKKLELDKRIIEDKITLLNGKLADMEMQRNTMRKKRSSKDIPLVSLAGYTNAGKSTIFNKLVERYNKMEEKKVEEKDMLFATLDTSVRNITLEDKKSFFISDTVGFISKLPHNLVKAFRSTLEEVKLADLIVQVIDFSDPNYIKHIEVTNSTLKELGANIDNMIYVYNKSDKVENMKDKLPFVKDENTIYICAKSGQGIDELISLIKKKCFKDYVNATFLIPYNKGEIISYFNTNATVNSTQYLEEGTKINLDLKISDYNKYKEYEIK